MKKIIITGGLGYIGSELCKLYSGSSRNNEIVVLDNRFASKSVSQLSEWGIKYVQGDIRDLKLLKNLLKDGDLIYHLAGITDVARTNDDQVNKKDELIHDVGVNASRYIIDNAPPKSKIVFPSTHVVFEGLKDVQHDIKEDEDTVPVLSYAKGKVITENDLLNSKNNFVIARLGTVYGYTNDMMRLNIMPNFFSKIASQDGTIRLFSGGRQYKSLISVFDAARCLKFLGENKMTSREIFHCSNENVTIKDVAEICKRFKQNLKIIKTNEKVPNLGYTFSNKKLMNLGFDFKYNLEKSIEEMIDKWSFKTKDQATEIIKNGKDEYIDDRGKISNYHLPESINLIGYIESKSGTMRANHFHPVQEQKCLLIKGRYISVLKDLANKDSVMHTNIINEGDLSIIPPNVAHTMIFIEDSIFINLVKGERDHVNYGVTHTIPYQLVDDRLKNSYTNHYKYLCRVCDNYKLKPIISLGLSPLANNLSKDNKIKEFKYPLEMHYCSQCSNAQLSFVVPPEKMFDEYLYVSSTSEVFRSHFKKLSDNIIEYFSLNVNSLVIDIGSNDGILLTCLKNNNINILGVEPAINICQVARKSGINTINAYFDRKIADKIIKENGKADIVTACNVFAHTDNVKDFTLGVFEMLKKDGVFIIEVQYILDTIKDLTFDNIYHEHLNYWSVTSLNNFFVKLDFQIFKVEHIPTHGGSLRVYISKQKMFEIDSSVSEFIANEKTRGLDNYEFYKEFGLRVETKKHKILSNLKSLKKQNQSIVGYGSPAKATTLLNYYNITVRDIDYIIEDNELKHGHYLPGTDILITSKTVALKNPPDIIIVLAWNFYNSIVENNEMLIKKGSKFISLNDLDY